MLHALALAALLGQAPPDAGGVGGAVEALPAVVAGLPVDGGTPLFPYPIDVRTLKNGLQVVLVPTGPGGLTAYYTLVRVGSRNEVEEGHTGFAHFFEHMMFRGTDAYSSEKYSQTLQGAGVNNNAETSDDFTLFTNYGPSEALPTVITVEADRFQHLKYSKEGFQTEAKAVLGEYNKDVADPEFALDEAMHKAAFRKSTYRHTTMGFLKDVQHMPQQYDYSLKFFKRWYVPSNTTIFVVGDFSPAQLFPLIEQAYGDWRGTVSAVKIPREPAQHQQTTLTVRWSTQTLPRVMVGFHAPSAGTDLKAAAIQNLLGPYLFGPASVLYKSLVLDSHQAVALQSWYGDHREPALFDFVATAREEKDLQPILQVIGQTLARLQAEGPDPKLLASVKSNQHYGMLMAFETPAAIAGALAGAAAPTGDPASLNALARAMDEVTPADVQAFAAQYLVAKNQTVVMLRPPAAVAAAAARKGGGR